MVTRGFTGRQQSPDIAKRLPPGQSLTSDFPVLSAGPWSKLDTPWEGVLIDDILAAAGLDAPPTPCTLAHSFDGYSTNVPTADLLADRP